MKLTVKLKHTSLLQSFISLNTLYKHILNKPLYLALIQTSKASHNS